MGQRRSGTLTGPHTTLACDINAKNAQAFSIFVALCHTSPYVMLQAQNRYIDQIGVSHAA
ncbi:hypothetical protein LY39_03125 [Roseinatronobacter bogoriensis subsp. barguzinensis]|nr:hypothetical protein [Rhodobaca bogoriensis DSM 18756]TDW35406.1 hypothetical protein LY39_03125 [Rhodobaca barguzinensis]TDY66616.1 hypothetical protein EV660_11065 [Rhodobaca bogoriensis DSM 18756]